MMIRPDPGATEEELARGWGVVLFMVQNSEFKIQGSGFKIQDTRFKIQGSGFGVQGSGFRVQDSDGGDGVFGFVFTD
jgi:hypothetical protein